MKEAVGIRLPLATQALTSHIHPGGQFSGQYTIREIMACVQAQSAIWKAQECVPSATESQEDSNLCVLPQNTMNHESSVTGSSVPNSAPLDNAMIFAAVKEVISGAVSVLKDSDVVSIKRISGAANAT